MRKDLEQIFRLRYELTQILTITFKDPLLGPCNVRRTSMKLTTIALGSILVATSVTAAPYYVGENLRTPNNITLGFSDTPTKKDVGVRDKTGNIMALELKGNYNVWESLSLGANLPFYMVSKNATTTGKSKSFVGNIGLGAAWAPVMQASRMNLSWGYHLGLDAWMPTSRKLQASEVGAANPTIDLFRYQAKATTIAPRLGAFVGQDKWSAKANASYAYVYQSGNGVTDRNRTAFTTQIGGSFNALPNLHINAEWNSIYLDKQLGGNKKFRHAVAPSISGNYQSVAGNLFASIPLDSTTRDITNVTFGLNVGYVF